MECTAHYQPMKRDQQGNNVYNIYSYSLMKPLTYNLDWINVAFDLQNEHNINYICRAMLYV